MTFKPKDSDGMEDDFILPRKNYKMIMVPPEKYKELKSIIEEVSKRSWFKSDWPMKCKLCGQIYPDHHDFCLVVKTKKVLEELEHE